ncbi:MAG: hypothetical protein H8D56_02490 [Planctomycetes bacterium]|nr:hypothetical protein [Planctomycetota bacterium]
MKSERQIKQLAKKICIKPDATVDERVLARAESALAKSTKNQDAVQLMRPLTWRIIMKNPITKLSAAAVIIVCIALTIIFMEKSVTPAYSFEQTLQAMQNLRTMYMVCKDWNDEEFEIWIELDPDTGIPRYCRAYWPRIKILNISRPDTSYQFSERANQVQINSGQLYHMDLAPAKVFEQFLLAAQENPERVVIFHEYDQQSKKSLIVIITRGDGQSYKFYIDPDTKLPVRVQGLEDNTLGAVIRDVDKIEFNVDLPEGIFDFEIPQGASIIDHNHDQKLLNDPQNGISTKGMTEQQAAENIATMYWNALISMDKTTARKVAPVSPQMSDGSSIAKLVEVGTLYIQPGCGIGKLIPCRIRYKDGSLKEWKLIIKARNIDGHPSCVIAGFYSSPVVIEQAK